MAGDALNILDIQEIVDMNPDQDKEFYMSYINAAFEGLDQKELSSKIDRVLLSRDLPFPGQQAVS